jgi:hypothetical protein
MGYDHKKVEAWLARVPRDRDALTLWLRLTEANKDMWPLSRATIMPLSDEWYSSETSAWERGNMLHGLRDIIHEVSMVPVFEQWKKARSNDDLENP